MNQENIDYAITKLNDAWAGIAPQAQEMGQEYVNYVVMRANTEAWLITAALALSVVLLIAAIIRSRLSCDEEVPVFLFSASSFLLSGFAGFAWYSAILANANPVMYAITKAAGL